MDSLFSQFDQYFLNQRLFNRGRLFLWAFALVLEQLQKTREKDALYWKVFTLNHLTDLNSCNFLWPPRLILQARLLLWLGSSPAPVAEVKDCYLQTLQIVYKRNYAKLVPVHSARLYRWMLPKLPTNLSACKPASPFQYFLFFLLFIT